MALKTCQRCGTELRPDVPGGFCPRCLVQAGIDLSSGAAPGAEAGFQESPLDQPGEPLARPHSPLAPSSHSHFGDYELLEKIAEGGMGVVYRARQVSLDRIVAVKMIQPGRVGSPEMVLRFRAEAEAAASLHHPNIVPIHETGECEGQHYFSMDFIEGQNLAEAVREGPLASARAAELVAKVAAAVHYAHQHKILHRDLKPSNVLLDQAGEPQITDFGLARRLGGDSSLTLTGQVFGSPRFMPPEQASGRRGVVGVHSDVYGLGAILYYLLTARPPFVGETMETTLALVLEQEPVSPRLLNASTPRDLETICLKCLEKDPARRYPTAEAVADELGRFLRREPLLAHPLSPAGKAWRWCRRRPALAGMGATLAAAILLGSAGVLWQWHRATTGELLARQSAQAELLQRHRAEASEYAADMRLAQLAIADGNRGLAVSLLDKYRPAPSALSTFNSQPSTDLRGWEWRYLWQLCRGDKPFTLHQYPQSIDALVASGDGKVLALATGGKVALWDLETKRPLTVLSNGVTAPLAFAANGSLLAMGTGGADGPPGVVLWDVKARKVTKALTYQAGARSVALSPDGKLLASFDNRGIVRVVEWARDRTLTNLAVSQPRYGNAGVVAFSPKGHHLAIGEDYGRIRLLDLQTGSLRPLPTQLGSGVLALAFSAGGDLLAAGCGYGSVGIRLWDLNTGEPHGQLTNHTGDVTALAFTPDGRRLVSASVDWTIRTWNVSDRTEQSRLHSPREAPTAMAMLPDGRTLVTGGGDGSVYIWDADAGRAALSYTNFVVSAPAESLAEVDAPGFQTNALDARVVRRFGFAFTPDSRRFITLNTSGRLVMGDAQALRLVETLSAFGSNHWGVALSPDGRWLATGDCEGQVTLWDWMRQHSVAHFAVPFDYLGLLHFSRNAEYLSASVLRNDQTSSVRLWRASDGAEVSLKGAQFAGLWWLDLSPDGRFLACGYWSGAVRLFRFPSLDLVTNLRMHGGTITGAYFSPDGRWLATTSMDGHARLWDVAAPQAQAPPLSGHLAGVWGGTFSPDGRRLATGGMNARDAVKLWDLEAHREILSLPCPGLAFFDLSFSPDGSLLAATSLLGIAHLWRAPSWQEIQIAEKGWADSLKAMAR